MRQGPDQPSTGILSTVLATHAQESSVQSRASDNSYQDIQGRESLLGQQRAHLV